MKRLLAIAACLCACRAPEVAQDRRALTSPPDAIDLDPTPNVVRVRLRAERAPGETLRYTYEGISPGPTIRAKRGDTLEVELVNLLDQPTTIHWHGVQVPWEMDGVLWRSSPVMPGASFTYRFPLPRAGTFWYHPHFDTEQQVDAGLYGALIVEDPADPPAPELVLVFDTPMEAVPSSPAHGHGRRVTRWLVNGEEAPVYTARGGTVVRARLINASNTGYLELSGPELTVIATDQGLLSAAARPERLLLGPGDRADLEWRIGEAFDLLAHPYTLNGGPALGDARAVLHVAVDTPAPRPASLAWPFTGVPVSGDPGSTDIAYSFSGSDRTGRWLINGERFPDVTVETLSLGQEAILEVRNVSPTEHPFHLHGLIFEVLSINGVAPPARVLEDTFNVRIYERVRLKLTADNPGDWMAHCHILPHAEDGLMTVLRVE